MKIKIIISEQIQYIEGNSLSMFLEHEGDVSESRAFPLLVADRSHSLALVRRCASIIRRQLISLGHDVEIENKTRPDPNFESAEAAAEFEMNGR